jgi:diguanylate cyclase (GGDEF)-like protein
MPSEPLLLYFDGGRNLPSPLLRRFAEANGLTVVPVEQADDVIERANRAFPECLVLDAGHDPDGALELCRRVKGDPFLSIVPVAMLVPAHPLDLPSRGLEAGADEVLKDGIADREHALRLELLLRRAARDVAVHPTTRLPGTVQIERDLARRMDRGSDFAFCYADLDHFKEFNDRYSYTRGDRVILLTSLILRDLVRALAPDGFVGHIGGDDFVFTVPLQYLEPVCSEIIALFDELMPYQYTPEDRASGYFIGKDRRGTVHRVPLMTISIGVVTSRDRHFEHTAQLGERAAEMKTFAKSITGSVYVVDRRQPRMPHEEKASSHQDPPDESGRET